ncbi:hypothetical protein SSX86_006146 [Deinandra increscens subsp. villosa]|uniref:Uncharacterized protein n=1 Tax=Deinandra increscens subsp. villosa TaxID=3103831 RepID=A0AAP0DRA7_9ASTR
MDKNKNRTDLLAAGRKKLQQYRQKKDGKGSKSSSKANKPDSDVITDESSSVAKTTKGKKQFPETELSVQDSVTEIVDSSNADMATPDLSSTSDLPTENSETDVSIDTSVPGENLQSSNLPDAMPTGFPLKTVNIEGEPESDYVSVTPIGLNAVIDGKAGEVKAASGEDQVPDVGAMQEHDHSCSEPVNTISVIDLEKDDTDQVNSGGFEEDTKMEYTNSVPEQTSEHDVLGADYIDLSSSTGLQSSDFEPPIHSKEDDMSRFHGEGGIKLPHRSGDSEFSPVSLTQIAEALHLLSEDEFRFVMAAREVVSGGDSKNDGDMQSDSVEFSERIREWLYMTNFEKELTYLQLCEEWDARKEIDYEKSSLSASLRDVEGKNKILSEEFAACRSQLDRVTGEMEKLQIELNMSERELSNTSSELIDSKNLLSELQMKNENLSVNVLSLTEEKHKLEKEKGDLILENGNIKKELIECNSLLELSHVENANTKESLALVMVERAKLEEEKENYVLENEHFVKENKKFSMELLESQELVESLHLEIAKLNENLQLVTEEKTRLGEEVNQLTVEKEDALTELTSCKSLLELLQVENSNLNVQVVHDSKKFSSELSESQKLVESLRAEIAKLCENLDMVTKEKARLCVEVNQLTVEKQETVTELTSCKSLLESSRAENSNLNEQFVHDNKKLSSNLSESLHFVESLRAEIATLSENLDLVTKDKTRLGEEVNRLTVEKKEALTGLTNCETLMNDLRVEYETSMTDMEDGTHLLENLREENANLTSTLHMYKAKISEFDEWKIKFDQKAVQETLSTEDNTRDLFKDSLGFVVFKKQLSEVEKVIQELEKAVAGMHSSGMSKLVRNFELKGQIDESEEISPSVQDSEPHMAVKKNMDNLKDLFKDLVMEAENASELFEMKRCGKTRSDSKPEEHSNSLEETFLKNVILDEYVKQYVFTIEAKKGELVILCENLRQEVIITRTKNSELTEELSNSESRIQELQEQVDELRQQVDNMTDKNKDSRTKNSELTEKLSNYESRIQELQEHVDELRQQADHMTDKNKDTRITNSELTEKLSNSESRMQELQEQVDKLRQQADHMTNKTKDLEGRNELASYLIHKVFENLQKIVEYSGPSTEQSEDDTTNEQLDDLEISNYDVLIEKLIMVLHERAQLESKNREYSVELLRRMKDLEELNKRCINPDAILKFFEDIQCSVTLNNIEIKPDDPLSSLESVIHFLIKNLKLNEMKSIDLQNEIDHLTVSVVSYEIQSHVLKGSLITAMEQIGNLQFETQLKESELSQSEQRVSALREKLHIAVTKGKGLIQQRESLKQNLTATSNELEKCLHELQLKDATLQETETKLKTYSEAGERMEALESELSYIRNSATALRESFLLKDSVIQRIEEILEDLDLPEDFHVRDIIDKIDWLAKSVSQSRNSFPVSNQLGTIERTRSFPESGSRALDGWREDLEPSSGLDDELRRNYEELQNKFYGLAEQNEMLEQSLMERNNLVQRWEEVLDKINMPSQFRSLEPEDRIEWLGAALSESNDRCALLQQDISELEKIRGSLATDLEDSQRRLVDLESTLKAITDEREQLSASLEAQGHDYNIIFEKAALYETENEKLQDEVGTLHLKLDEKCVNDEHIRHIHGEIRRLQDLVKEMLQVAEIEDLDSNTSDIQCLEALLRKLADKHITEYEERSLGQSNMHEELERKLEVIEGDLVQVKDERERLVEKSQTLINEVEALKVKNQELQNLLVQEEQKTATVKEKLNVAVRKGKSLVQVRDSMKQTINDLTSQVDRLNDEIKVRENTILELQQKMRDLFVSQESVENKDSEIRFLKNRLEESESELQDKRNTMSMILGALAEINPGVDLRTNDPLEKMKQIGKFMQDLQAAMSSAEQDSRKSKRAAELLLAELNEVQERNEDLLEEISELSKQRDLAEDSKRDFLSRFEQLSSLHLEERNDQFSELMNLKSCLVELSPGLSKIYNLLNNVLPKELDHLYNLEADVKSLLELSDTSQVGGQILNSYHGGIGSRLESMVNVHLKSFLDSKTEELHNDDNIFDLWKFVESQMKDLTTSISSFEEKLQNHSKSLHEEVILLCEKVPALSKEVTSHKHSLASAKEEIAWLESTGQQKETENVMLRKYISILYEACKNSVLEIEKSKGQMVANDSFVEDILSGETVSSSEEGVLSVVNRLLSAVKDLNSIQTETAEAKLKEMKATISSLQKEVTEKDVQKDRISVELVGQIKRAEAAAMSHLQELESAKSHIKELKDQCNLLEQRVKELEAQETVLVDLHEKVKSLTEALTAKEQENEALLQALDEEEAQMEGLTNKITELERLVQHKNLDLESTEAARGKALKKLSVTVSKFDELHHLSETLVSEVDKLQSQLQERDSEVSFLRDEITRITSESLQALKADERGSEIQDILTWLDLMASGVETRDVNLDDSKNDQGQEYKEILKKQITSIISELKDLRQVAQSKDDQLHIERSKVDELMRSLREKESQLSFNENGDASAQPTSMSSEIVEVEPLINKWPSQGTAMASQVRSLRKVNNDQLAISIDEVDSDDRDKLDDDDDKAHGFKSLTTSKFVPRFTRPVTDFVDGLWVSCDRTLMRQPVLRLSLIFYWAVMHALLAVFVV